MYTKEESTEVRGQWAIVDPDGDIIAYVKFESEADVLLSYLNRG